MKTPENDKKAWKQSVTFSNWINVCYLPWSKLKSFAKHAIVFLSLVFETATILQLRKATRIILITTEHFSQDESNHPLLWQKLKRNCNNAA